MSEIIKQRPKDVVMTITIISGSAAILISYFELNIQKFVLTTLIIFSIVGLTTFLMTKI